MTAAVVTGRIPVPVGVHAVMALPRVYLRAHWLSDTVAGALPGAGLALGWPALLMALRARRGASAPPG